MKELSIEEKAKRYDEALERAKMWAEQPTVWSSDDICQKLFPELKENEDERIKKAIKKALQVRCDGSRIISDEPVTLEEAISWLEKQGESKPIGKLQLSEELYEHIRNTCACIDDALSSETLADINDYLSMAEHSAKSAFDMIEKQGEQKPADKVEPKFKIGDWIITDKKHIWMVDEDCSTTGYLYRLVAINGKVEVVECEVVDEKAKLWTIQDAKDGDVLCTESGWTCIFKALNNHTNTFSSYCFMDKDKWFCDTGSDGHTLDKAFIKAYNGEIRPATKEQRDTLMKAMTDAGYTFDFDKKELKKIEQKPAEWSEEDVESLAILLQTTPRTNEEDCSERGIEYFRSIAKDFLNSLKYRCLPPKQEWGEEDERIILKLLEMISTIITEPNCRRFGFDKIEAIDWLKHLKDRFFLQPIQKLNEEDIEKSIEEALVYRDNHGNDFRSNEQINTAFRYGFESGINWLKSLRPQKQWKPSEEQMEILQYLCETSSRPNEKVIPTLESLYQDLKKLK